jgi:AcrR family transcriptional regulator
MVQAERIDPRVRRTRQLLLHSFCTLMEEKDFSAITIQDIAERAMINRATFYGHFEDKYALMDTLIREQFREEVKNNLSQEGRWGKTALRILIQTVLEFFRQIYAYRCQSVKTVGPLVERVAQQEINDLLLAWLKEAPTSPVERRVPAETVALVSSWAIFGAAIQWSRDSKGVSSAQMTDQILTVVIEGIGHLSPTLVLS